RSRTRRSKQELPGRQTLPSRSRCARAKPRSHAGAHHARGRCTMIKQAMFAGACCLAACATDPLATSTAEQDVDACECPPNTPASLAPAADQDLAFTLDAIGVQIYNCTNGAWVFSAPDAQLYKNGNFHHSVGHHFAGPMWEYQDG